MLIEDLSYLETVAEPTVLSGAAGTLVAAAALAFGNPTLTLTRTNSRTRPLPRGGALSIGWGFGVAKGDLTAAEVVTAGSGDIVVGATRSSPELSAKPVSFAVGVIVAIDLPA